LAKKTPWTIITWDWDSKEKNLIGICKCPLCGENIKISTENQDQKAPKYATLNCKTCQESLLLEGRKIFPLQMKMRENTPKIKNAVSLPSR
jgi:hypothetical protein